MENPTISKIGKEVKKELQPKGSKIKWTKDGKYCLVRLDLHFPYDALGILDILWDDIKDIIQIPKRMRAQQMFNQQMANRGGEGVVRGAKSNPSWFKKTFGR